MANASRHFTFELVAPEKVEVSGLEDCVMLPGTEGDFMVLPGHTLLLAALRPGLVSVIRSNGNKEHYFVEGGMADVGNEHCIVLSPHITHTSKMSEQALASEYASLVHLQSEAVADKNHNEAEHLAKRIEIVLLKRAALQSIQSAKIDA